MRRIVWSALVAGLLAARAEAQRPPAAWEVEVGMTSFQGGVRDTDNTVAGPEAARIVALRRAFPLGRVEVGLGASYQKAGFGVRVPPDYFAGFDDEYTMLEFAPEVRFPLRGRAGGAKLFLLGGPTVQHWQFDGSGRTVIGGILGTTLITPISPRFDLTVRGEYARAGSWANENDTSGSLSKESTRRWRWSIGFARHRVN